MQVHKKERRGVVKKKTYLVKEKVKDIDRERKKEIKRELM
jgi:hypothetical protein